MTRVHLLRVLGIGFALVMLLLAAVAYIGNDKSHEIRKNATQLLRDHLVASQLIDQLEVVRPKVGSVLLRILRHQYGRTENIARILEEVEENDRQVQALVARSGQQDRPIWLRLGKSSAEFKSSVQATLSKPQITAAQMEALMRQRDQFLRGAADLIRADSARASATEQAIERQSIALVGESAWLLAACFVLAAACAGLTMKVTNDSFRELELRTAELSRVSWHMLQGQEVAARRFSHEMHDELGQSLTGLKATLSMITPGEFQEKRDEYTKMLEQAIRDVRELSQLLRPVILDDFGLDAALRWVVERFQERTRLSVTYDSNFSERVADETETHLFRITQESLTNVARHSGATEARVSLLRAGEMLHLTIEDNGKGMPRDAFPRKPGLGMIGIRARASQAGGEMRLTRSPLGGVRIEIEVPFRQPKDEPDTEDAYLIGG